MNIPSVRASMWMGSDDVSQSPAGSPPQYEYNAAIDTFVAVRAKSPASPPGSPPKPDKVTTFLDWIGGTTHPARM